MCLAVIISAMAQQSRFPQEVSVGASFGMNFSSVSFNPKVYTKMKQGYNAGLVLRWNTEKNLGLQTELNFSQQGWDEEFEEHPTYKYSRTINYFEIPFFTHIYFGSNRFKFYFNLGPKIGYAFSEKTETNPNETNTNAGSNEQHNMAIQKNSIGDCVVVRGLNCVPASVISCWKDAIIMRWVIFTAVAKAITSTNRPAR